MNANVGSQNNPVSYLHQRAVGLLWDVLQTALIQHHAEVCVVLPDGKKSHDLMEGVGLVKIPGEWDSVGGIVPDLICYGPPPEGNPVRVIEVVVTNPPSASKTRKLDSLRKRGVDVVIVTVKDAQDLCQLVYREPFPEPNFNLYDFRKGNPFAHKERNLGVSGRAAQRRRDELMDKANDTVENFIKALEYCAPELRLKFIERCRNLDTLDSIWPLSKDNPLRKQLQA